MLRDEVTSSARAAQYRASGLWNATTLPDRVIHWARERPDATAVVDRDGQTRHSYADVARDATRIAHYLGDLGVGTDDIVSVQLPNWYETVVVGVGVLMAGAVVNPLLPNYREREITHVVEHARSRIIFTPATYRGF